MSSYTSFLSLNTDDHSADGTGTANFLELDLLQNYSHTHIPQSPFSLPDYSDQVSATPASSSAKCHTMSLSSKKTGTRQVTSRIAFRTKSDVEVLDDGYRWRKYGKKLVKTNSNPRNYYRCASVGCGVKKRVERARDDLCYIITTYEGVHNHHAPITPASHHYYNQTPI